MAISAGRSKQHDKLQRVARTLGAIVAAFWLFVGIVEALTEKEPWTLESAIMGTLMTSSIIGVIVCWFREGLGALIVLAVAVAHTVFAYTVAGHNKGFAVAVSGGPFFIIGALFLACWWRSRSAARTGRP